MARSPWRDALDGQLAVLRACHTVSTFHSLTAYFLEAPSMQALGNQRLIRQQSEQHARVMLAALEHEIREAEPFFITHDVAAAITRGVHMIKRADHPFLDHRFALTDLPARSGLLWFDTPIYVQPSMQDQEEVTDLAMCLRGLFFDRAYKDPVNGAILLNDRPRGEDETESLGIVAWIDSDRSPFFQNLGYSGLVPWVHLYLAEGQSLGEYLEEVRRIYGDNLYDVAMQSYPAHFLTILFGLLQQRVLRFGGSGLERDARRQAERNGLKSTIQVVTWRKAEYRYPEGHIPGLVNWSCQWPSRPHLRHLRNPDGSIRKTIVVKGCIKGPKHLPLKEANTRVNHVKR